jgi:hypothetical protein
MRERQARGVQELTIEAELARPPVDGVACDREVDRRKVDPNLVCPPRLEAHVEERVAREYSWPIQPAETANSSTTIAGIASVQIRDSAIIAASALLGHREDRVALVCGLDYSFDLADSPERERTVPDGIAAEIEPEGVEGGVWMRTG